MMHLKYIDSRQPIVPDKSLGGVLLRANIGDYGGDIFSIVGNSGKETKCVVLLAPMPCQDRHVCHQRHNLPDKRIGGL
jgi:hypothetical protein